MANKDDMTLHPPYVNEGLHDLLCQVCGGWSLRFSVIVVVAVKSRVGVRVLGGEGGGANATSRERAAYYERNNVDM